MANTQLVLSMSRNYTYKPHNPFTSDRLWVSDELRLC